MGTRKHLLPAVSSPSLTWGNHSCLTEFWVQHTLPGRSPKTDPAFFFPLAMKFAFKNKGTQRHLRHLYDVKETKTTDEILKSTWSQIRTCQEYLPSDSVDIEFCAVADVDLWHALKGVQGGEWSTLCSRETGGKGLQIVRYFQDWLHDPNPYISSYLKKH